MKLILSRKGFDSQSGGCPSPIFPDGTLYSLPIPDDQSDPTSKITYKDLWHGDTNIGEMVADLTGNRIGSKVRAHLDPDINHVAYRHGRRVGGPCLVNRVHPKVIYDNQGCANRRSVPIFWTLSGGLRKLLAGGALSKMRTKLQHVSMGLASDWENSYKVDELAKGELPWARYHHHLHPWTGDQILGTRCTFRPKALNLGGGPITPGARKFPSDFTSG